MDRYKIPIYNIESIAGSGITLVKSFTWFESP